MKRRNFWKKSMMKFELSAFLVIYDNFHGVLIGEGIQVTSQCIFWKSNTVFDTMVDLEVIPNPALDDFFFLELPLIAPAFGIQALSWMQWCIERFVVKNVSAAKIGANKGFVNSNQSLSQ